MCLKLKLQQSPGSFPVKNGLKEGHCLKYAIWRIQANQEGLKLNGAHKLLVYADHVNVLGENIHNTRKNTEAY